MTSEELRNAPSDITTRIYEQVYSHLPCMTEVECELARDRIEFFVKPLEDTIERLQQEVERLTADAERLDWLEKRGCSRIDCCGHLNKPDTWEIDESGVHRKTLRAAIDSARGQ